MACRWGAGGVPGARTFCKKQRLTVTDSAARVGRTRGFCACAGAHVPPAVGQCVVCKCGLDSRMQLYYTCQSGACRCQADVLHANVQGQVWRGGPREGSGRDASVLPMLQRDCMVSMPAIRASQPSPTRALVHSQQVALTRAQDAAAELELSCGPSTTQLEAAEDQAR